MIERTMKRDGDVTNAGPKTSDYFAEMYVAGKFADAGWNVYFPRRDKGFDFIVSKEVKNIIIIRPVQVKGKYPTDDKGDKTTYGYTGKLSETHPEMVLAMPFFSYRQSSNPVCVAYMPIWTIRPHSRGYRCSPACFRNGEPEPRRDYRKYFDIEGLEAVEFDRWSTTY
jgi:hypothetical protein